MTYVEQGTIASSMVVSRLPDKSGNFVCDGVADDVEILAAMAYLILLGGGELSLLHGIYNTLNNLTAAAPIYLRGMNKNATTIRGQFNGDVVTADDYWCIRDLTITCVGFGGPTLKIADNADHVTVEECILVGKEALDLAAWSTVRLGANTTHLRILSCEIRGGANGAIWSLVGAASPVWIKDCWIHNNFARAIAVGSGTSWFIDSCRFSDNENEIILFSVAHDCFVIDCTTNLERIRLSESYRISIIGCLWASDGNDYDMGIIIGVSSYDVHVVGCIIKNAHTCLNVDLSSRVIVTGCTFQVVALDDTCVLVNASTYVMVTSCSLMSLFNGNWRSIMETGASNYNLFFNLFCYNPLLATGNYAKFVGANTTVENIFGNSQFRDQDGTMTAGGVGTYFTYEDQQGEVAGISTAALGKVSAAVVFTRQYPTAKVPKVIVSLVDVNAAVNINTVEAQTIVATGFTRSINVVTAAGATTCKLHWRAHVDRLVL